MSVHQNLPNKATLVPFSPSSAGQDLWNTPPPFQSNGNDLESDQGVVVIAALSVVLWAGFFGLLWVLRLL